MGGEFKLRLAARITHGSELAICNFQCSTAESSRVRLFRQEWPSLASCSQHRLGRGGLGLNGVDRQIILIDTPSKKRAQYPAIPVGGVSGLFRFEDQRFKIGTGDQTDRLVAIEFQQRPKAARVILKCPAAELFLGLHEGEEFLDGYANRYVDCR